MASRLSSLVDELRVRLATSSSSPPQPGDDVVLVTRFRTVLPNLLNAYVIASPTANEREVIAVLKLVNHTAKNFPGVFYDGKSDVVLPIIGRILPFFAEPAFRSRHGVIFDTIGSLLALLRSGDRDAYLEFFVDTMLLVEDLLCAAPNSQQPYRVSLRCFAKSFSSLPDTGGLLTDLRECNKPADGHGISIDLVHKERWGLFSTWTIRLLNKYLTEGTLYVDGLVTSSLIWDVCHMLCYGDADLLMACFDFARIVGTTMKCEVPWEEIILSIAVVLSEDDGSFPVFRCPVEIITSTAAELVSVFYNSVTKTKSSELQVSLCNAYIRISRSCPPHVWKPDCLINMILSSSICFTLRDCFEVAVSILGPACVEGGTIINKSLGQSIACDTESERVRVGCKRSGEDLKILKIKRQKAYTENLDAEVDVQGSESFSQLNFQITEKYASDIHFLLVSSIEFLKPPATLESRGEERVLAILSMLCMVFCKYPNTKIAVRAVELIHSWIPWICKQANQNNSISFDLTNYLDALHSTLLLPKEFAGNVKQPWSDSGNAALICSLLQLPWTHSLELIETHQPWRAKCLSIKIFSKIAPKSESELGVVEWSLHDEVEEVRIEAIWALPVIVLTTAFRALSPVFKHMKFLEDEVHEKVRKMIPKSLGYLSCLHGFYHDSGGNNVHDCKGSVLSGMKSNLMVDTFLQRFWCFKCDKRAIFDEAQFSKVSVPEKSSVNNIAVCDFHQLQSLFFSFLYDNSSEEVQLSCIEVLHRILLHVEGKALLKTRSEWIRCIEFLLLHRKRSLREAFCTQISFFFNESVLIWLFPESETKDQLFLDLIKSALEANEDTNITETLLECLAEILLTVI
ncbi:hypothetical protein KSS87_006765 [Heliosperma pusillum]|nr:hypothetical protein KSS87_006765 [Heliosperma pusillum]